MATFASTFSDIYGNVVQKLRLDATLDATRAKAWVNIAYQRVAIASGFFSSSTAGIALTVGASSQALPTTIIELEYITCAFGGQVIVLRPQPFEQILRLRQSPGSTGPPTVFNLRKNTVEFWPNAAGSEVLTYYGSTLPDQLVADADLPAIPEPFATKCLEYGACIEGSEFKADIMMLGQYSQEYGTWLGAFLAFNNRRMTSSGQRFQVLTGSPGYFPNDPSSDYWIYSGIPWR